MTSDQGSPAPKPPWHRGWLDPRVWVIGIATSILAVVILNFLPNVVLYCFSIVVSIGGNISDSFVDRIYERSVGDPLLRFFVVIVDSILLVVPSLVFANAFNYVVETVRSSDGSKKVSVQKAKLSGFPLVGVLAIFAVLLFACTIALASVPTLTLAITTTETRRLMVLDPYITDQEHKELVGQWGRVETKADFDKLMKAMEKLAADHHTTLPRRSDQ